MTAPAPGRSTRSSDSTGSSEDSDEEGDASQASPPRAAAAPGRDAGEEAVWKAFSPAVPDPERCQARVWGGGQGLQCTRAKKPGVDFCGAHENRDTWRVHGRVDGPIPEAKLREFQRARGGRPAPQRPAGEAPPKKRTLSRGLEEQVRQQLGELKKEELLAAEPRALAEAIQVKRWEGEEWRSLSEAIVEGRVVKEEAVEKILRRQEEQLQRALEEAKQAQAAKQAQQAEHQFEREAHKQERAEKRQAAAAERERQKKERRQERQAARPATAAVKADAKAAGGAAEAAARKAPPGPAEQAAAGKRKELRCTCGLPIHSEKCKAFRPIYHVTTKYMGPERPFPQRPAAAQGSRGANGPAVEPKLSEWARREVDSIEQEVTAQPKSFWKDLWKKQLLIYHPDKRNSEAMLDGRFAGRTDMEVTEVFMAIKRRYDKAATEGWPLPAGTASPAKP